MHLLLKKQLKKYLGLEAVPENLAKFIDSVDATYIEFENDRALMERSVDISSREYNEKTAELKAAQDYLSNLISTIPMGIVMLDREGKIIFANSVVENISGLPRGKILGSYFRDQWWKLYNSEGQPATNADNPLMIIKRTRQPVVRKEYSITTFSGEKRTVYVNAAPLTDPAGEIAGVVMSVEDITVRKQMEQQLKYLSLHDSLTRLYNRTFFEEELNRLDSGQYKRVGVIIVDIDGLKLVNDTLGHAQGDKYLLVVANIIRSCFQPGDVVARIGGDEIAVLLKPASRNGLSDACQKLHKAVDEYNFRSESRFPISISVGFAFSGNKFVNMIKLFKEADNNMYREKLHHQQSIRSALVKALEKAMEARDFSTQGHADRLQRLAEMLAVSAGVSEARMADIRLFAHFHDIGKVGIPDRIFLKRGPLTEEEADEMRRHCEIGYRIAQSAVDLAPIADWILKHHEWWNGNGYPLGLEKEEIPVECRLLSIVDAYDAITNDRPYRKAMNHEQAVAELLRCAGTQFDPELVQHFISIVDKKSI